MRCLPRRDPGYFAQRPRVGIPAEVHDTASRIVDRVRDGGEDALRAFTLQFGERSTGDPLYLSRSETEVYRDALDPEHRRRLERIARRIETFAKAQREALTPVAVSVAGGSAGHTIVPVERAGCYAPGGRYPLPSSVLMTVVTARVAGVGSVWVASPKPTAMTIAAAAVAGADGLLVAGGAHAIAALAYGVGPVPASDIVVGPGNLYVTAAKQLLFGEVAIDMLAGPSELVVLADDTADPVLVAVDLLAQAEHDVHALPVLITTSETLSDRVAAELARQLPDLPTGNVAAESLSRGGVVICETEEEAVQLCNDIAPEHVQISVADPDGVVLRLRHYGAAFIGEQTAEVFGDYGMGPNHVLPTGRSARAFGGLSVLTFLRVRTWLRSASTDGRDELIRDCAWLAREEGLEAHARAAEARLAVGR